MRTTEIPEEARRAPLPHEPAFGALHALRKVKEEHEGSGVGDSTSSSEVGSGFGGSRSSRNRIGTRSSNNTYSDDGGPERSFAKNSGTRLLNMMSKLRDDNDDDDYKLFGKVAVAYHYVI